MFSAWLSLDRRRLGLTPNTRATASVRLGRASLFKSQPLRPWATRYVDVLTALIWSLLVTIWMILNKRKHY